MPLQEKGAAFSALFVYGWGFFFFPPDTRHFLRHLRTEAYRLLTPAGFLEAIESL